MSEITREEWLQLADKCNFEGRHGVTDEFLMRNFRPHISRDDAALVELAIEGAGLWEAYESSLERMFKAQLALPTCHADPYPFLIRLTPAQRTEAALVAFGIRGKS